MSGQLLAGRHGADAASEQVGMFAFQDSQNNIAFNQLGSIDGPWNPFSGTQDSFRIDAAGSTTPEPGSLILLGSGVLGVAGLIRRPLNF